MAASKGRINQGLRFRVDAPENDKNVYVRAFRERADGLRAAWEAAGSPPEPKQLGLIILGVASSL